MSSDENGIRRSFWRGSPAPFQAECDLHPEWARPAANSEAMERMIGVHLLAEHNTAPAPEPRHRFPGPTVIRADRHGPIACVAHGDPDCDLCSLIYSGDLEDGGCRECSTFAEYGMHWDTCPNRIVVRDGRVMRLREDVTQPVIHRNAPCTVDPILPDMQWPKPFELPAIAKIPEFADANLAQSSQQRTNERNTSMDSSMTQGVAAEREPFDGISQQDSSFDQQARDAMRLGDLDLAEWIARRSVADVRATLNALQGIAREHDDRASAARSVRRQLYGLLGELASNPDDLPMPAEKSARGPF